MNNPDSSEVMDCNTDDVPQPNNFTGRLCCEIQEVCFDGQDNDGDGFVDCADPDCNEKTFPSGPYEDTDMTSETEPQICDMDPDDPYDANNQSTAVCASGDPNCLDPEGERFYCAYGDFDAKDEEPQGMCCPQGEIPQNITVLGVTTWQCGETAECGTGVPSGRRCDFDINATQEEFFDATYDGDASDYCVSQIPSPHRAAEMYTNESAACCYVPKYGEFDYWFKDGNVEVYG
jgi:hypothetical protein